MICLPVKHENRTEAKCTFIILRVFCCFCTCKSRLYLESKKCLPEALMWCGFKSIYPASLVLSTCRSVFFFFQFFARNFMFELIYSFNALIWFWSLYISARHLWLCIARSHTCCMLRGTDESRGGKVALRRGGVKSAAEDAGSSCRRYVFFIRNKSHSFCAVKTVHQQEVKQNIKKQSPNEKIQMGAQYK